ncbi:hypothetical protein HMPREF1986_02298 [Oribacterium sp. oral taxon 078 str. F0263]|nr:hypothetical protein HMPREF1986_02298 [Oribacterium sp. oral taxon 078 str. F0263]
MEISWIDISPPHNGSPAASPIKCRTMASIAEGNFYVKEIKKPGPKARCVFPRNALTYEKP